MKLSTLQEVLELIYSYVHCKDISSKSSVPSLFDENLREKKLRFCSFAHKLLQDSSKGLVRCISNCAKQNSRFEMDKNSLPRS